jgi:hypothetical protein
VRRGTWFRPKHQGKPLQEPDAVEVENTHRLQPWLHGVPAGTLPPVPVTVPAMKGSDTPLSSSPSVAGLAVPPSPAGKDVKVQELHRLSLPSERDAVWYSDGTIRLFPKNAVLGKITGAEILVRGFVGEYCERGKKKRNVKRQFFFLQVQRPPRFGRAAGRSCQRSLVPVRQSVAFVSGIQWWCLFVFAQRRCHCFSFRKVVHGIGQEMGESIQTCSTAFREKAETMHRTGKFGAAFAFVVFLDWLSRACILTL